MQVIVKELPKSQVELSVVINTEQLETYLKKAALKISEEMKIPGFRPGKAPYDILKAKIGEMSIAEEAARLAINKTLDEVIEKNVKGFPIGQPQISITKLAPGNPLEYKVILVLLPKLELGAYKDLGIKKEEVKIDEKDVEKTLDQLQQMRVVEEKIDRAAKDGDKLLVKIEMFLDKVPLEGGQSQETAVILGKDYIIPGFDKQLIGGKKDEAKEFKLPYPEDHYMKNLAGKMVEFKVTIKEVFERRLPEVNDEFAKTLGFSKLDELKKNIKEGVKQGKEQDAERKADFEIMEKVIEKTKFSEIPEILINNEVESVMHDLEHKITSQGGRFSDYLDSLKKTRDQLTLDLLPEALKRVKGSLVMRELALKEKIEISDKELEKKQAEMLKQYSGQRDIAEKIQSSEYRSYLRHALTNDKVIKKLREWNSK